LFGKREQMMRDFRALTAADLQQIDAVMPVGSASGDRYRPASMQALNR